MPRYRLLIVGLALVCGAPVLGQETEGARSLSFTLGAGAQTAPAYFGSDAQAVGPTGSFSFGHLKFGGLSLGGGDPYGFGVKGAFRYVGARTAAEFPELAGLADIAESLELGAGVTYAAPGWEAFGELRYGVLGHESLVGEAGLDLIYPLAPQVTLAAGPRVLWGSDDYAATYFGVSAAEAAASRFAAYDAAGGILSAGLEAEITYQINDDWGVVGTMRYDRLQNAAADSPISVADDQVTVGVVLTRRIAFSF